MNLLIALALGALSSGTMPGLMCEDVNALVDFYRGFEPNLGQLGDFEGNKVRDVIFFTRDKDLGIFITDKGASYVIYGVEGDTRVEKGLKVDGAGDTPGDVKLRYARVGIELEGGSISGREVVYEDELPGYTNYYLAHCPEGVLNVKSYRKVRIKNVYPGIDWVWKYEGGRLNHEFEVEPGADVGSIKLRVKWADVEVRDGGRRVVLRTPIGDIEDGEVMGYEGGSGNKVKVLYVLNGDGSISFSVEGYRGSDKLVIDPPLGLLWATYYGGSDEDRGYSIVTDPSGNVFITGTTSSTSFPTYDPGGGAYYQGTRGGTYDVFILKFSNSGVRLWATYYGGTSEDFGYSITTDVSGNVFLTGYTKSGDFPIYDPGNYAYYQNLVNMNGSSTYSDAFILKFSNSGVRLWATYYGGSNDDVGNSIVTDQSGNVFVTGYTSSSNFPTYNPGGGAYYQGTRSGNEVFILKFSNVGTRLWATFYGGEDYDYGSSISIDRSGNLFLTGFTFSYNLPTQDPGGGAYYQNMKIGIYNAFILKFSSSQVLLWATYYGSGYYMNTYAHSIATDRNGNVYITGNTNSDVLPINNPGGGAYYQETNAGGYDAFISKFSNGGVLLWATFYGGSDNDCGRSINTDQNGNVFVTGETKSTDFPTYNPGGGAYFQGQIYGINSNYDAFILKFSPIGVRLWSTFYGGSQDDYGRSIILDPLGKLFITGNTYSTDSPTFNAGDDTYYQLTNAGVCDAFILKFDNELDTVPPNTPVQIFPPDGSYFSDTGAVTFLWHKADDPEPSSGIMCYICQYSYNPDFSIIDTIVVSDTFCTANLPDTTYYWRVRAMDVAGNMGSWSEVWQFTVDTHTPDVPTLIYPINGVYVNSPEVVLKWSKVTKVGSGEGSGLKGTPVRYVVQVDTVSTFASPIRVNIVDVESLSVTLFERYPIYWRVKAYDLAGNEGSYSSSGVFGIDLTPPAIPVLISPTNNSNISDSSVIFMWQSSTDPGNGSGVSQYILEYVKNPEFENFDSLITGDTVCTVSGLVDTTYYWRVRAVDRAGNLSSWSEVWQFTIDTRAPDAPTLVYPINGVYVGSPHVVMKWSRVSKLDIGVDIVSGIKGSPVMYVVEVDTVSTFASPIGVDIVDVESLSVTLFERYPIYWRVKAYDLAGNEGSYSSAGVFGIDLTPPAIFNTTVWNDTTYAGPFEVKALVLDNVSGVDSVLLYYMRSEDSNWVSRRMCYSNGWYVDTIPAVTIAGDTVCYYIEAYDIAMPSNIRRDPSNAPQSYYSFIANLMSGIVEGRPKEFGLNLRGNLGKNGVVFEVRLPGEGEVDLRIYDATGRLVDEPMSGLKRSGRYEVMWSGKEGIYFYVLESKWGKRIGRFVITGRN